MSRFKRSVSLSMALILCLLSLQQVSAEPSDPLTFPFYDSKVASTACSGVVLSGAESAEKTFNFFISKGLTAPQAAGIMGNLQAESGINPRRVQSTPTPSGDSDVMALDGTTGYGIAQWTSLGRQQGLHAAAVTAGKTDGDLGVQLNYLWTELEGAYKREVLDPIKATQDVQEVTSIFMLKFERPKDQSAQAQQERGDFSRAWLAKYGSGTAVAGSSDTVSCGGGEGEVTNGYSLPTDRKWYDKYPQWFTKPHHDYPAADIPLPTGTPIYSMTDGKVIRAGMGGDCGQGVIIEVKPGLLFLYCHGSDGGAIPGAKQGDVVKAGQLLMHSASTGNSTGPHLHLEIQSGSKELCPQTLFTGIVNGSIPQISSLPASGCTN